MQEGPSYDTCGAVVLSALKHQAECGAPQLQCTFNGTWGGPRVPKVFYISSYFWDRATDAGGQRSRLWVAAEAARTGHGMSIAFVPGW